MHVVFINIKTKTKAGKNVLSSPRNKTHGANLLFILNIYILIQPESLNVDLIEFSTTL